MGDLQVSTYIKKEIMAMSEYMGRAKGGQFKKRKWEIHNLFSKLLVITLVISIYGYVFTVFYFVWNGRHVPDSLTYTLLPTILGQLFAMSTITRKDKDVQIAQIQREIQCNTLGGDILTGK